MVLNFKKYLYYFKLIVIFITILSFTHCSKTTYKVTAVDGARIGVSNDSGESDAFNNFILPYKFVIDRDLDSVLSYNPEILEKSKGKWQTNIGDWMAKICYQHANTLFNTKTGLSIDLCLLNHGGIRSILPKGKVSARNAYEIMPFENSMVVIALTKGRINELAEYFVREKKPHPIYGMQISLDKNHKIADVKVNGELLENNRIYYVLTSDYLANGGDNMTFFLDPINTYDLDYKIRNVLIDEFKNKDTLIISKEIKIIEL